MYKTDDEIWEAVIKLKGKTVNTITKNKRNKIEDVQNTGSNNDAVIIARRNTQPLKSEIVEAYQKLYLNKKLDRKTDLVHLANINKQVSSIVFAIIYEIAKEDIELVQEDRIIHFELTKTSK